jgi:hypothetical protein
MRTPQAHQATVDLDQVKIQGNRLTLQAQLTLELPLPDQDADLPRRLEATVEYGGQILKRRLFPAAIERADRELVLAQRHGQHGQGIVCRGTTPFTFKTVFGTVKVRRQRIQHRADGSTEVPSAGAWQTPRQVAVTAGLWDAVCDGLLVSSAQRTVARIDQRAGEARVLAKTTVLEIVHDQGRELQRLAHTRAEAVFQRDGAAAVLLPAPAGADPDEEPAGASGPAEPARLGDSPHPAGSGNPAEPATPGDPAEPVPEQPAGDRIGFAGGPPVARHEVGPRNPDTRLGRGSGQASTAVRYRAGHCYRSAGVRAGTSSSNDATALSRSSPRTSLKRIIPALSSL